MSKKAIKVGETYPTRNGCKVTILCTNLIHPTHPVAARLTKFDGTEFLYSWTIDGRVSACEGIKHVHDLILEDPLDGLPIDAPVWVRFHGLKCWTPCHYAGIKDGTHCAWVGGGTSHTTSIAFKPYEIRVTKPADQDIEA